MRNLFLKSLIFSSPILMLYVVTVLSYTTEKGDLARIGYLPQDRTYYDIFKEEFNNPIVYSDLSLIDTNKISIYTVLTVGDSFSERKQYGYNNYLAMKDSISVIHFNGWERFTNPIQVLYGLINGDLFDKLNLNYVILESAEREIVGRTANLDRNKTILLNDIKKFAISNDQKKPLLSNFAITGAIFKFPAFSLLYLFNDHAFISQVFRLKTIMPIFSGKREKTLLCYTSDFTGMQKNNEMEAVNSLNDELNNLAFLLSLKGIELIVLPAADKFDVYYDVIENKEKYNKPLFFDLMEPLDKDYIFINSKELLVNSIASHKDLYFFDDSHWSPWGAKMIACELSKAINESNY